MTDSEYIRTIESLVVNNRGFQAIVDLTKLLDKMSANKDAVINCGVKPTRLRVG